MQQQAPQQEIVSPSLLIEVFDRFITKSLEADSNYSFFLKEWGNFKNIISKGSVDLEEVFKYLAHFQLNLAQLSLKSNSKDSGELDIKSDINSLPSEIPLNKSHIKTPVAQVSNFTPNASHISLASNDQTNMSVQTPKSFVKSSVDPALEATVSTILKANDAHSSPNVLNKASGTVSLGVSPFISKQNSSTPKNTTTAGALSTRIQIAFLAEKARSLHQNVQRHSQRISEKMVFRSQQLAATDQEDRTPLKKVIVYAKTPNLREITNNIDNRLKSRKIKEQREAFIH